MNLPYAVFVWSAPVQRILDKVAKCKEACDALQIRNSFRRWTTFGRKTMRRPTWIAVALLLLGPVMTGATDMEAPPVKAPPVAQPGTVILDKQENVVERPVSVLSPPEITQAELRELCNSVSGFAPHYRESVKYELAYIGVSVAAFVLSGIFIEQENWGGARSILTIGGVAACGLYVLSMIERDRAAKALFPVGGKRSQGARSSRQYGVLEMR